MLVKTNIDENLLRKDKSRYYNDLKSEIIKCDDAFNLERILLDESMGITSKKSINEMILRKIYKNIDGNLYNPSEKIDLNKIRNTFRKVNHSLIMPDQFWKENPKDTIASNLFKLASLDQNYYDYFYEALNKGNLIYDIKVQDLKKLFTNRKVFVDNDFLKILLELSSNYKKKNLFYILHSAVSINNDLANNQVIYYGEKSKKANLNDLFNVGVAHKNEEIVSYVTCKDDFNINAKTSWNSNVLWILTSTKDPKYLSLILDNPKLKIDLKDFIPYLVFIKNNELALKYINDSKFTNSDYVDLVNQIVNLINGLPNFDNNNYKYEEKLVTGNQYYEQFKNLYPNSKKDKLIASKLITCDYYNENAKVLKK